MIVAEGLTKHFDATVAVNDVSFRAQPGQIIGLVGHEGAGKTTALRMLVGHVTPSAGSSTILGKPYGSLDQPLRRVGVMLDSGVHPARIARDHLRICAALAGVDAARVDEVLGVVGLQDEAGRRARNLSPGMRRRLAIAAALLAEPEVLILDEPGAGLDPEALRWLRSVLRNVADDGRTVLVASQDSDELEEIADQLLVMDRGSLLTEAAPGELTGAQMEVLVRSPGAEVLADALREAGITPSRVTADEVRVRDVPAWIVSEKARVTGVPVWELREVEPSLEEAVVELTRDRSANGASPDGHNPDEEAPAGARGDEAAQPRDEEETALDVKLARGPDLERSHVVAVLAPVEGLGRTTLSFLVADVLAAGAGMATLAVALSVDSERLSQPVAPERRTSLGLADLMHDLTSFDDSAHISPYVSVARSGAHVLSGPERPQDLSALEPEQLEAMLDFARRFYTLIVVDVGGLSEPSLRAVVRRADRIVLLGAPGAVDDLDEHSAVLAAIEAERDDPAIVVFNLVDEERLSDVAPSASSSSHVLVPQDRELVQALMAGDFELGGAQPTTRAALKRLALAVAENLR